MGRPQEAGDFSLRDPSAKPHDSGPSTLHLIRHSPRGWVWGVPPEPGCQEMGPFLVGELSSPTKIDRVFQSLSGGGAKG